MSTRPNGFAVHDAFAPPRIGLGDTLTTTRRGVPRSAIAPLALLLLGACGGGSAPEPNTPAPLATASPDEEGAGGIEDAATLDVMSGQPTEIKLDGKPIGKTPITNHKVSPGTHDVTFMFSEKDSPTLSVTLGAGEAQTVKLDPPPPIREGARSSEKK